MSAKTQVWSCGGGTQSACIAAMICNYDLERPDVALIVDTGREKSSTWDYYDSVLQPVLRRVGVELVRIHKSDYATVDLYAGNGDLLLPVFTGNSKLPTYCSNEWKRRVTMRWLKASGVELCETWLGMSADELKRVRVSDVKWLQHRYPLIEFGFKRQECIDYVLRSGWPMPPRSACWMCPNMSHAEWEDMRANQPEDFVKAVLLEQIVREDDANAYFHQARVPLSQVDWANRLYADEDASCNSGYCFV